MITNAITRYRTPRRRPAQHPAWGMIGGASCWSP